MQQNAEGWRFPIAGIRIGQGVPIDTSGIRRDRTSHDYRNRVDHSFRSPETTVSIDVRSQVSSGVNYTTRESWDGHVGMEVCRRNAEGLHVLAADANCSRSDLREECRSTSARPLIEHEEHTPLKQVHNARLDDDAHRQRWTSETGFSRLKADDGETLRSRRWHGQFREFTRECISPEPDAGGEVESPPAPPSPDVSGRDVTVVTRMGSPRSRDSDRSVTPGSDCDCVFRPDERAFRAARLWTTDLLPT